MNNFWLDHGFTIFISTCSACFFLFFYSQQLYGAILNSLSVEYAWTKHLFDQSQKGKIASLLLSKYIIFNLLFMAGMLCGVNISVKYQLGLDSLQEGLDPNYRIWMIIYIYYLQIHLIFRLRLHTVPYYSYGHTIYSCICIIFPVTHIVKSVIF